MFFNVTRLVATKVKIQVQLSNLDCLTLTGYGLVVTHNQEAMGSFPAIAITGWNVSITLKIEKRDPNKTHFG